MIPISIILIAKNEEKRIEHCLSAIREHCPADPQKVDLLLVDTGSTDDTIAIAQKYTEHIEHFTWCDDFSAARNYAMSKAYYDHIIFIDSDEYVESCDWDEIQQLIRDYPDAIGQILRRNICYTGQAEETTIMCDRVERCYDHRLYHYEGFAHEQITRNDGTILTVYPIPFTVLHDGYLGSKEQRIAKAKRNDELMLKELEKHPDDPYIYFQLGQSAELMDDYENAYNNYVKAYTLHPDHEANYVPLLMVSLLQSMMRLERLEEALQLLAEEYDYQTGNADFLCAAGFLYTNCGMLVEAIDMYEQAIQAPDYFIEGKNSFLAHYNLGCIYDALENEADALKHFSAAASDYPPAKNRLDALQKKLDQDDLLYWKKVSAVLVIDDSIPDLSGIFAMLKKQTIGMSHMEIILLCSTRSAVLLNQVKEFEKTYDNSVLLITNIDTSQNIITLYDIGFSYASAEYICFLKPDCFLHPDAFRCLRTLILQYDTDFICSGVDYQNEDSFVIENPSPELCSQLIQTKLLGDTVFNRMYSMAFLQHFQLTPSQLANNHSDIKKSQRIACIRHDLLH